MKFLKKIWSGITTAAWFIAEPFISVAVLIDESKRQNLDGSWDSYWAKKNARAMKREARRQRRKGEA